MDEEEAKVKNPSVAFAKLSSARAQSEKTASSMANPMTTVSRNRRISRQVLDCGDGVREVTALALPVLEIPKLAADTTSLTESGDSENSVAPVQDARAESLRTRFMVPMRGR